MTQPEHATRARYEQGCRCYACKKANAAYQREYRRARTLDRSQ